MVYFEKLLIQHFLLLLAAATAVSASMAISKPGCPDRCGNLTIPYPFGTREGCYFDDTFLITCNATDNTPYLGLSNIEVLSISLDGGLRISSSYAYDCYDEQGPKSYGDHSVTLSSSSVSFSINKFVSVGCDNRALIMGYTDPTGYRYLSGCSPTCFSNTSIVNGSCPGNGWCEIPIPKGTNAINISLSSYSNHSDVIDYNPCGYAFVVEEGLYNFNTLDLAELQTIKKFPLVLDWTIGNITCSEAKRNLSGYACKDENSECVDSDKRVGYLCNCSFGFQGNPYLSNGCQDGADLYLDDCVSTSTCRNTVGSYTCICPNGYMGDRRKAGLSCLAEKSGKSLQPAVFVGVGSGLGFLLLLLGLWFLYKLVKRRQARKTKQKFFKRNGGLLLEQQLSSTEEHVEQTKLFSSKELEIATDYYNVDRILGQGGQGTVYKGMLTDGKVVAIKRSKIVDEDQLGQFINEVVILSQINHRNVVKLFGCCLETEVPLLVYEFIPNGTLFELLHNQDEQDHLSITWRMRLRIAAEVAGAIAYLHSAASMPIYHRDIKTSNILLDEKYRAKVADFGTSKSILIDQTHVTTRVQGTCGYLDPEYFQSSQFTEKSDVYSFGVVLVELLTGKKPISMLRSVEERNLATYFLLKMEDNGLFDIVDGQVQEEGREEEIIGIANLAKSCLNLKGKMRPNMKTVAMELERVKLSEEEVCSFNEPVYGEVDYDGRGLVL